MAEEQAVWIIRFMRELRRRKVFTAAAAYVGISLVLMQGGGSLFTALGYGTDATNILTLILVLAFPVVIVMAWIFDVGPSGVRRTEPASNPPASFTVAGGELASSPSGAMPRRVGGGQPVRLSGRSAPAAVAAPPPSAAETVILSPDSGEVQEAPDPARVQRVALAHVRHELRTPINAIIGYSEMLLEDAEEAGGQAEVAGDLRRIRTGGRELLALVDSILDPERIAAEADTDLGRYGERIRADLRTPVTGVIGYAEMLLEGGHDELAADLERILGAARHLLELSEDIVGVATGRTGSGGAELGQAAALAQGVLAKLRPLHARAADPGRAGSLLVVDDNPTNRDLLSRQLARSGYVVATAATGEEAFARMAAQPFDVVLLDILMPDVDGLEVLRRMKADAQLRSIPVIMISSLDEIEGAIRCLEAGAADYLTKPFDPRLLEVRIGGVLEVQHLREREHRFRELAEQGDVHLDRLLRGACPGGLAERVRAGDTSIIELYPNTAVAWCTLDRVVTSPRMTPEERVAVVERALGVLEEAAAAAGVDTVLLKPPAIILATGIGAELEDGAIRVADAAFATLAALRDVDPTAARALRIGLHVGEAWAAVFAADRIGVHLWGDAPDLARRLERQAEPGCIHVSPAAQAQLRGAFLLASRGVTEVHGRGQMRTFTLTGRAAQTA